MSKKSFCCNARLLLVDGEPLQCEACGANGVEKVEIQCTCDHFKYGDCMKDYGCNCPRHANLEK